MATIRIPRLVGKASAAGVVSWYWQPSATLRKRGWQAQSLGQGGAIDDPPADIAERARSLNAKVDGATHLDAAAPADRRRLRRIQRPLTLGDGIRKFRDAGYPSVKRPGYVVEGSTATNYRYRLDALERWGGDVALTSITPQRVAKLRDALMQPARSGRWAGQVRHHEAHSTLRVGRTLFKWLEQQGLVARGSNPFSDFGLSSPEPRQEIWWQPAREAILAASRATVGADGRATKNVGDPALELAIDLAFSIGQREGDLLKLQVSQYAEIPAFKMHPEIWEQLAEPDATGRRTVMGVRIRQKKGKRWIEVPVVGATRARVEAQVAAAKEAATTSLLFDQATGLPWTQPNLEAGQRRFIRAFGDVRDAAIQRASVGEDGRATDGSLAAEIAELQFRDFRRTAVVYLGELGIEDHLIAAITGHTLDETKKILETYMPRTTGMAARAIALSQARGASVAKQEQVK